MIYVTHDQLEASTFADKIAVMHGGRIVQFGTPRELFERPRHTFVGYFVGSPGMNLVDVQAEQHSVRFGELSLGLSDSLSAVLPTLTGKRLQLGIRPEFVHVAEEQGAGAMHAEVVRTEDLGTYKVLTFCLEGQLLKARLPEDQAVPQGYAWVSFPGQWLMLYA